MKLASSCENPEGVQFFWDLEGMSSDLKKLRMCSLLEIQEAVSSGLEGMPC